MPILKMLSGFVVATYRVVRPPHRVTTQTSPAIQRLEDRLKSEVARASKLEEEVKYLRSREFRMRPDPPKEESTPGGVLIGFVLLVSILWFGLSNAGF